MGTRPGRVYVQGIEAELREMERTDPAVREAARSYYRMVDDFRSGYADNVRSFAERVRARCEQAT